jgi:hypothetical protein
MCLSEDPLLDKVRGTHYESIQFDSAGGLVTSSSKCVDDAPKIQFRKR